MQQGGVQNACTSALGVVVSAAAAPELLSETFSGLIEDITNTLLSDPKNLDLVISSGSQKRQGKPIIWNEDTMPRAAAPCGSGPSEHMHPCIENPFMMLDCGPWGSAFG